MRKKNPILFQVNGKKVRGRQYPWGFVEVDNPKHSDFALLRRFLIQTHMQDLKDVTHDVHYENYRVQCLSQLKQADQSALLEQRKQGVYATSKSQENLDEDTEKLLAEKDEKIKEMHEMIRKMQAKLNH